MRSYTDLRCIPRRRPSSTTSSFSHGFTGGSRKPFTRPMCPSGLPPTPAPATSRDCSDGKAQLLTTPMRQRGSARTAANAVLLILPARRTLPMWPAAEPMPALCELLHPRVAFPSPRSLLRAAVMRLKANRASAFPAPLDALSGWWTCASLRKAALTSSSLAPGLSSSAAYGSIFGVDGPIRLGAPALLRRLRH